jgi:hypothetical protein
MSHLYETVEIMLLDALGAAQKELGEVDLASLSDEELNDLAVETMRRQAAQDALTARIVAACAQREAWRDDGAKSAAAWLARKTGAPRSECGSRIALGKALRDLPRISDAFGAGEVGTAHVRKLLGAYNRRTAPLFERDEGMLAHQARTLRFSEFSRVVDYWFQHADPDGADQADIDRRDRRRVSFDEMLSGMWSGTHCSTPSPG